MKDGTFVAQIEKLGMKDGVVSLVYNPALVARIPAEAKARVDAAQREHPDREARGAECRVLSEELTAGHRGSQRLAEPGRFLCASLCAPPRPLW